MLKKFSKNLLEISVFHKLLFIYFYSFFSYKRSKAYTAITWFLISVSAGILRLIFHWWPHLMLKATHSRCTLEQADTVLLKEKFQGKHTSYHVKKIKTVSFQTIWYVVC